MCCFQIPKTVIEESSGLLPSPLSSTCTMYLHNKKTKKVLMCNYNWLQRLKNKLGTRQLPTAELLLDGSRAYKVSREWKTLQFDPWQLFLQRLHNANSVLLIHDTLVTNLHFIELTPLPKGFIIPFYIILVHLEGNEI